MIRAWEIRTTTRKRNLIVYRSLSYEGALRNLGIARRRYGPVAIHETKISHVS